MIAAIRDDIARLKAVSDDAVIGWQVELLSWLLDNGRFYHPSRLPASHSVREAKYCFCNAQQLAIKDNDLGYVEGYAFTR